MAQYDFRSYQSNPNISGNWNTGGAISGRGSQGTGITQAAAPYVDPRLMVSGGRPTPRPRPAAFPGVADPPRPLAPRPYPGNFLDGFFQPPMRRVDFQPGIVDPPAGYQHGGFGPGYDKLSFGPPGGGKFQDRITPTSNGFGRVGGGRGGGGGGGY